jgi:hypothetical protein
VLNVVDDVIIECLAAVPDTSVSGQSVVGELTQLIVSDKGTEVTSNAMLVWCGKSAGQ